MLTAGVIVVVVVDIIYFFVAGFIRLQRSSFPYLSYVVLMVLVLLSQLNLILLRFFEVKRTKKKIVFIFITLLERR